MLFYYFYLLYLISFFNLVNVQLLFINIVFPSAVTKSPVHSSVLGKEVQCVYFYDIEILKIFISFIQSFRVAVVVMIFSTSYRN